MRQHCFSGLLAQTITPIQHARCIVAAAPHLPDILYICSQLYVEEADLAADIDALPDMNTIFSDMSSYWSAAPSSCQCCNYSRESRRSWLFEARAKHVAGSLPLLLLLAMIK